MEGQTVALLLPSLVFYMILTLPFYGIVAGTNISITLKNTSNETMTYDTYSSSIFYGIKRKSVGDRKKIKGYLRQPEFISGCFVQSNVTPHSFAVIENYPGTCKTSTLLRNVKHAGYKLVIFVDTVLSKSSNFSWTSEEEKLQLPIVAVSKTYKDYLTVHALSSTSNHEIEVTVAFDGKHLYYIVITVMAGLCGVILLWLICCTLCCYCRNRRLRRTWAVPNIQQRRQRNFERLTDRDRIARRELVNSILRQLQQLQLEGEIQRPLGMERTRGLPTQKYQSTSIPESCVICVEDFESEDTLRVLPCGHYFHISCIDEWLINHSDVCPLCKNQVTNEEPNQRQSDRSNTALSSFDETEEMDTDPLVSTDTTPGQGRLYGSV